MRCWSAVFSESFPHKTDVGVLLYGPGNCVKYSGKVLENHWEKMCGNPVKYLDLDWQWRFLSCSNGSMFFSSESQWGGEGTPPCLLEDQTLHLLWEWTWRVTGRTVNLLQRIRMLGSFSYRIFSRARAWQRPETQQQTSGQYRTQESWQENNSGRPHVEAFFSPPRLYTFTNVVFCLRLGLGFGLGLGINFYWC